MPALFIKLKRRYADLRFGYAQIGIVIGLANFLLLAYNFTNAKNILSFPIFVIITACGFSVVLILIGKLFRNKQMGVDHDLGFENAPLQAKTFRIILEQFSYTKEATDFIEYLKRIERGEL